MENPVVFKCTYCITPCYVVITCWSGDTPDYCVDDETGDYLDVVIWEKVTDRSELLDLLTQKTK